jgi:hypothetical protein
MTIVRLPCVVFALPHLGLSRPPLCANLTVVSLPHAPLRPGGRARARYAPLGYDGLDDGPGGGYGEDGWESEEGSQPASLPSLVSDGDEEGLARPDAPSAAVRPRASSAAAAAGPSAAVALGSRAVGWVAAGAGAAARGRAAGSGGGLAEAAGEPLGEAHSGPRTVKGAKA